MAGEPINVMDGINDLAVEFVKAILLAALPTAPDEVKAMLGNDNLKPKMFEGGPNEDPVTGAAWADLEPYPNITITVITEVADIFALISTFPGDHVLGTVRVEVKAVGKGTGFNRLKPLKRFIFVSLEGAPGMDLEGGSVATCSMYSEWPRTIEPTDGGDKYYHSGYQFDITAQRGGQEPL